MTAVRSALRRVWDFVADDTGGVVTFPLLAAGLAIFWAVAP